MTAINLMLVLVLGGLLATGSWGIGKRTFRLPPPSAQDHFTNRVAGGMLYHGVAYPTRGRDGADDDGLRKAQDLLGKARDEFDNMSVPNLAVWDDVVKEPGKLKDALAELKKQSAATTDDGASQQLRKQLADPVAAFKVDPLPQDFIANLLVPRKGEDFDAMADGKEVAFVWVDKAGCWIAADESPDKPGKVRVEGVAGDVACQSPTEQQWRAAAAVPTVRNMEEKKAEYLRDNKVIGKSYRVQDDAYDKPMDEDQRKKQTINKAAIAITADSPEVVRYMDEWKKHNPDESQAAFNAERRDFMRELSEEKFAYRWVIEPPLPQAP